MMYSLLFAHLVVFYYIPDILNFMFLGARVCSIPLKSAGIYAHK